MTCPNGHKSIATYQRTLFPRTGNSKTNNGLKDPAFFENKKSPIHRWVPWIAGFSAGFVDSVFDLYLQSDVETETPFILDPFAGVGTTIFQAVVRGYDAVGFDINPYASLAARTKARCLSVNIEALRSRVLELEKLSSKWRSTPAPNIEKPPLKTKEPFFSPRIEKQVLHALDYIDRIDDGLIKDLFRIAFGSVMVGVSNYSYEPSLGTRRSAGKPAMKDADFARVLSGKCREMLDDIISVKGLIKGPESLGDARIRHANFLSDHHTVEDNSVDLLITSPPYLNNYHYVRNTRPQLYWLSFVSKPDEQKGLETGNFGKYWQEVRGLEDVPLTFEHEELRAILSELKETRKEAGVYGGSGWANYVASYFNDTYVFWEIVSRVLKTGGSAVIVIGNSVIQGIEIEVDRLFGEIAREHGLKFVGTYIIRDKRVGSSITDSTVRYGKGEKRSLYDAAVLVEKPGL